MANSYHENIIFQNIKLEAITNVSINNIFEVKNKNIWVYREWSHNW